MPRLSSLPRELQYLLPFRRQTAKLKPEEIDESMDLSLLNKLLCKRIEGLTIDKGQKKLQEDQAILEDWLLLPNLEDNGGMFFLRGYLMALPELVDRLLEEKNQTQEIEEIHMELPPGAKVKKRLGGSGGLEASWKRTTLFAFPENKEHKRKFQEQPQHHLAKIKMSPVAFGSVTGFKRLVDLSIIESMQVEYALEAPGGYASVSLLKTGISIDESKFEQYFHTIRVVRVQK